MGGGRGELVLGDPGAGGRDHGVEGLVHQLPGLADAFDLLGALDMNQLVEEVTDPLQSGLGQPVPEALPLVHGEMVAVDGIDMGDARRWHRPAPTP